MGTLNVRSMTARGRELEDKIKRRKVDVLLHRKQSGKRVKQGILDVAANCSKMELVEEEMGLG